MPLGSRSPYSGLVSPTARTRPSRATVRAVARSSGELGTLALRQLDDRLEWYRDLTAAERSQVGLVAQAGISEFVQWMQAREGVTPSASAVFDQAPAELTRSVTLRHTLDLVRTVVDVVESQVPVLAEPGEEQVLRESVLRFSREIAFAAAEVYAGAAEARGAWDARLESLVVDAVLRGQADESMQSRAAALGWGQVANVTVVAGRVTTDASSSDAQPVDRLRRLLRRNGIDVLATVQRERLIAVLGGTTGPHEVVTEVADDAFGAGPIVIGPTVPHLFAAGRSARAAMSGLSCAPGWPGAPRVVLADQLLPERAMSGEQPARRALVERVHRALTRPEAQPLRQTAEAYIEAGGSLEATARALFVHTNTVRYRLGRIIDVTGYDLTAPRERLAVQLGLAIGSMERAHQVNLHALAGRSLEVSSKH